MGRGSVGRPVGLVELADDPEDRVRPAQQDPPAGRSRLGFRNAAYAGASKGRQLPKSASWNLHAATVECELRARCISSHQCAISPRRASYPL